MKHILITISILLIIGLLNEQSHSTSIDVYAEGDCTATHLIVDIFADIVSDQLEGPLRSAGVKLSYPTALLTNPSPKKNENDWYFGLPDNTISYNIPDTSVVGEIVFLLGKFDQAHPLGGVDGQQILLGTVIFTRKPGTAIPVSGDFSLSEGRNDPFVDFMTTLGKVLDDSVFYHSIIIQTVIVDSDNDGIEDSWEMKWFFNLYTATQSSDYDQDGYTDLQEYVNEKTHQVDPEGIPYNPTVKNAPGGTGYTPVLTSSRFWLMMLPVIIRGN